MSKRSTREVITKRVAEISTMLLNGESRERILHFSTANYGIKERMTERYIAKAQLFIEKSVERKVESDYAKAIRRLEELYRLSMKKEDIKTALLINKELTQLQGLHKIKVENSGNIEFVSNIPD